MFDVPETPFWLTGKHPQTHEFEYNNALIAMQKRNMQLSTLCLGAEKALWKGAPHRNGEVAATDPAGDAFFGESQINSWKRLLQRLVTGHSGACVHLRRRYLLLKSRAWSLSEMTVGCILTITTLLHTEKPIPREGTQMPLLLKIQSVLTPAD